MTLYERIEKAARDGKGLRLSAEEARAINADIRELIGWKASHAPTRISHGSVPGASGGLAFGGEQWLKLYGEARLAIDQKIKSGGGNVGTVPCPKCGKALHYSRAASNGHIWGRCETAHCIAWME